MALGEDTQPLGIFLYTTGKTLIGEVKQRQPAGKLVSLSSPMSDAIN